MTPGQVGGAGRTGRQGVLTVTYLKGFSPVCVRMWLLSVVAPANARPQNPHLKGRSLECVTTWFLRSDGCEKDWEQWPHWYGLGRDGQRNRRRQSLVQLSRKLERKQTFKANRRRHTSEFFVLHLHQNYSDKLKRGTKKKQ